MTTNVAVQKSNFISILSYSLAAVFALAGSTKLLGAEMQVQNFSRWGLPDWTRPVVGLTEVAAAALLLVPRTRFYGAAILSGAMAGAILTHLVSGVDLGMVAVNAVLLAATSAIAWNQRHTFFELRTAGAGRLGRTLSEPSAS